MKQQIRFYKLRPRVRKETCTLLLLRALKVARNSNLRSIWPAVNSLAAEYLKRRERKKADLRPQFQHQRIIMKAYVFFVRS
jgi:hypothetical protein